MYYVAPFTKDEFIAFQHALELKELGFDEPCVGKIYADGGVILLSYLYRNSDQVAAEGTVCSAPLYQQAFRWFREKYDVHMFPKKFDEKTWWVQWGDWESSICETYKEAELESLLQLIQIAKGNYKSPLLTRSIDRSSYIFRMISYHLSNISNEILNQDDDKAESSGTAHIKQSLEHQHIMGSFEAILEGLDTLAIEICNDVPTEVLEGYDEMLYDYVHEQFLNSYR